MTVANGDVRASAPASARLAAAKALLLLDGPRESPTKDHCDDAVSQAIGRLREEAIVELDVEGGRDGCDSEVDGENRGPVIHCWGKRIPRGCGSCCDDVIRIAASHRSRSGRTRPPLSASSVRLKRKVHERF